MLLAARDACGNQSLCTFTVTVTLLKLTNTITKTGPVLTWPGGAALEKSGEVSGPWLVVRGAASPFPMSLVGNKNFFRLTAPVGDADCGQVVFSPSVWNIDVPSVRIHGRFLLNSRPFPSSFFQGANFFLRRASTGDEVYLGLSNNETFDRRVVRGTYRVRYEYDSGTTLPRNTFATLGSSLSLTQNVQTVIDVRTVALSGDFRLNGGAFPGGQNAAITARSLLPGDSLYLGGTQNGAYSTVIVPGHYGAFYNWAVGDLIPRNQNARLVCPR